MSTPASRSAGQHLGPYELVRPLGRGAVGEVWEAVLHGPGGFRKPVALKLLRADRLVDPELRRSLLHEARVGALVQHPNVVGTLGVSELDGQWMVALELVRGASLAQVLAAGGPLSPRALLEVGAQVAAGLAHAHDTGLVHRDVKPGNLLLDRTGFVRLADLGIASVAGTGAPGAGTPGYAPPEQVAGRPEPRSDVFSLGATLYALALGRKPFSEVLDAAEIERLVSAPAFAAPLEARQRGLGDLLVSCLRGFPDRRPRSAREVADACWSLRAQSPEAPPLVSLLSAVHPDLAGDAAVTSASEGHTRLVPTGNLGQPRDTFVGRRDELRELRSRVLEGADRLLVLLGPGGSGKTRLAIETARVVQRSLHGGSWAFDLAEARTEAEVCRSLADALSLDLERDAVGQLARVLSARGRALFVFDNLEGCLDALPRTLGRWLELAPEATFLATSRVRLDLLREVVVPVGPLATADGAALFLERARCPVTPDERLQVDALVEAVDGLPLAIELAAARVRVLGVSRVRERLSLQLLSGGARDLPERHRSLQASLDWSASLLGEEARAALGALSVFEGGCGLDAAEAVLGAGAGLDGLSALEELVDASLVRVDRRTGRFSLLAVVREYAAAHLRPAERALAEAAHAAWYAQAGSPEALEALSGPGGPERWHALADDLDNVLLACRRAAAAGRAELAARALAAAWAVLARRGSPEPVVALADELAASTGLSGEARGAVALVRAAACSAAGRPAEAAETLRATIAQTTDRVLAAERTVELAGALRDLGRLPEARTLLERALTTLREAGRPTAVAHAHLGLLLLSSGLAAEAVPHLEAALRHARARGDREAVGTGLGNLALACVDLGRPDEARGYHEEALAAHRETGHRRKEATVLANLGLVHLEACRWDEAVDGFTASVALHREVGNPGGEAWAVGSLALVALLRGQVSEALAGAERSLGLHREVGNRLGEAVATWYVGRAHAELGELEEAERRLREALALARRVGSPRVAGLVSESLGATLRRRGRSEEARALLLAAEADLGAAGMRRQHASVCVELARAALSRGDLDDASTWLARAAPSALVHRLVTAEWSAARAELLARQGDAAGAAEALREAEAAAPEGHALVRRSVQRARAVVGG